MIEYLPSAPGEDHCRIAQRVCSHPCLKNSSFCPKTCAFYSQTAYLQWAGRQGDANPRCCTVGSWRPSATSPTRGDVEDLNPRWLLLACRGSPPHAAGAGSSFYLDIHPRAGAFITALGEENTQKKSAFFWVKENEVFPLRI